MTLRNNILCTLALDKYVAEESKGFYNESKLWHDAGKNNDLKMNVSKTIVAAFDMRNGVNDSRLYIAVKICSLK